MLSGIHILLTYQCTFECDHCFLHCSPLSEGTMTLAQVRTVLQEAQRIGTVEWIYFEGGEPLLYSLSMLEGVRMARNMGFDVGVVTNAYWAVSDEDADLWLRPLAEQGIADLSISEDEFHCGEEEEAPAKRALASARRLGIPTSAICIEKPVIEAALEEVPGSGQEKGTPVVGGGVMFKGRAADKLTDGLPRRMWQTLTECPYEDLASPSRVHVDSYGHVHVCQGVSIGNMWQKPLSEIVRDHHADLHPICGPLMKGGPALLATEYDIVHEDGYVDECHFCYSLRQALRERFPESLGPEHVYGL